MTEQLPDDRAEQAARDWFAQQASGVAPGSIDPAAVRAAAGRRQRLRLTGLLAAAAVVVAVLVAVPLALRPPDPPITGIPAPAGPTWTTTAQSPLSPRFGSLTAWLDGRFYVLGGWGGDGGPCPPGSVCDMKAPNLRDGATYDPATDSWEMIAEAPLPIGRDYAQGVAFDDALYVQGVDGSLWVYLPGNNEWQPRTRFPADGRLVAIAPWMVVSTYDEVAAHYVYQPSEDFWALPTGPLDSCDGRASFAAGERLLVVGRCGDGGTELRSSFFDSDTHKWSEQAVIPEMTVGPTSDYVASNLVYVAGKVLWPSALSTFASTRTPGIYDIEEQTWRPVSVESVPGGLSFRGLNPPYAPAVLEDLGLVEANGDLLDVRTGAWVKVPEAPVPDRWDPVVAASPDSLLSCFGYRYADDEFASGDFSDGCQLLTLGASAPSSPTSAPESPTPSETAGAALGWRDVAPPDAEPRKDPLLVAANGSYYLMGGWRSDADWNDIQLRTGFRLDPVTGAWTPIAELPEPSLSHPYTMAADVVGATIYVHFTFEEMGELWAYDTMADRWEKIGDTGETEWFVGNADGLFRISSVEEADPLNLERLDGATWTPVTTSGPAPAQGADRIVVVDDHTLAWVAAQISLLDTRELLWQKAFLPPDDAPEFADPEVIGGAGALVLVYKTNRDSATPATLDVFSFTPGGEWQRRPASTDAGGLNWFLAGPSAGRWVVVHGNLLDPASGEWSTVPEIPGKDGDWEPVWVAGGPQGFLTCFPKTGSVGGADFDGYDDGCWFLDLP